ncbi:multiple inositol polyphosphate phosphatase 1 isoform X1 [Bombyx mori]|uniref:Multiple inositol polyphosphate phosphatase 1 n=2 Tax=Bombyx mori TaxID=7091 RepID=A0A8R2AR02_BOMMO|nr:multiple inositol polyphosphate phosphatase 1 [Bombyx mori]
MKFLFVTVFLSVYARSVISLFCYWNTGCPYNYFSSRTPYNAARGDIRDSVIKLTDCEPISIWGLVRHGKRNPGAELALTMKNAIVIREYVVSSYENGNSSLCAQDIENLRELGADYGMFENAYQLSEEGYQEMMDIGKRFKQAFPKLLNKLESQSYTFRPAFGKWMQKSAEGFVNGLANGNLDIEKATTDFDIMDPYTTCGKYQRDVKKNPEIYLESNKYLETTEFLATKDRIQRRLGIDYPLTNENISALYDLCRYTWSSKDKMSPWCALFTTEDLKVLEYAGDLKHYYRNGYGNSINAHLGQIPLSDLFKSFQLAKDGKGKKIIAYFTHATMMDMLYTALNLFKDDVELTGSLRNPDRKWRTSKLSIFGANMFAVLSRCNRENKTDYNVVFYLNEEPLKPICEQGVCTWEEFENKFKTMNSNTDMCQFKSLPYI